MHISFVNILGKTGGGSGNGVTIIIVIVIVMLMIIYCCLVFLFFCCYKQKERDYQGKGKAVASIVHALVNKIIMHVHFCITIKCEKGRYSLN